MQKGIIIFLISGLLLISAVSAQNSTVSNAIQAFHENEYEKAFKLSGDALANIDELTGDYIPAAYYYLAKSRIQLLRIALENGDQEKLAGMQNVLIESYFDYKEAMKTAGNQLKIDIQLDLTDLYNPILQTGLSALNTSKDPGQPENVRLAALDAAQGYLEAAKDISPTYLACDLLGQAKLASGDSLKALELFSESTTAYSLKPPSSPDFLMAYVYFRKAMIERYFRKDNMLALATLLQGENLINIEYSKLSMGAVSAESKYAYENGLMDLIGFELDIYLNDKSLINDAIVRFQEVMMMYPEDYDIHVSYANLLEDIDPNLAIDAYETAISIDDSKELAFFNLGAMYNNLGSEYYMLGLNHDDDAVADSLHNEANIYFRKAYTNMESAYQINPYFMPSIRALVQLATSLGLEGKASFYKRKELELRGF